MRFLILAVLLILATTSCEPGASSYRLTLAAVPSAVASVGPTVDAIDTSAAQALGESSVQSTARVCGYAFEAASAAEAEAFLIETHGTWRDHLASPVLTSSGASEQPGIEISSQQIATAQIEVTSAESNAGESAADGLIPTGATRARMASAIAIGPELADGFRVVQLSYAAGEPVCETYGIKADRLADGRLALLVRGPLSPVASQASSLTQFDLATRAAVRVFVR